MRTFSSFSLAFVTEEQRDNMESILENIVMQNTDLVFENWKLGPERLHTSHQNIRSEYEWKWKDRTLRIGYISLNLNFGLRMFPLWISFYLLLWKGLMKPSTVLPQKFSCFWVILSFLQLFWRTVCNPQTNEIIAFF